MDLHRVKMRTADTSRTASSSIIAVRWRCRRASGLAGLSVGHAGGLVTAMLLPR